MTHVSIDLPRACLVAAAFMLSACGGAAGSADVDAGPAPAPYAAFIRVAGHAPQRVISVGLDSESYAELVAPLGGVQHVFDRGPSANGLRELELELDVLAAAPLLERMLGPASPAKPSVRSGDPPELSVLLANGGGQPIGLLLPAVQKFDGAALQPDGRLEVVVSGAGEVGSVADITIDPAATEGGAHVAVGDVTGDGVANEMDDEPLTIAPAGPVPLALGDDGWYVGPIAISRPPTGLPPWFVPATPLTVVLDVRGPDGRVLHRLRVEGSLPTPDAGGLTVTLGPAKAGYIKIDDIKGETTDGASGQALVEGSYASFAEARFAAAEQRLSAFFALSAADGQLSEADVHAFWGQDRALVLADFYGALSYAGELEALVCQVALPDVLTSAQWIAAHEGELDRDPWAAVATTIEAVRRLPHAIAGATAGGPLALAALVGKPSGADATPACRALRQVLPFLGRVSEKGALDPGLALDLIAAEAVEVSPRELDRLLVEWIGLLDDIVAGTVADVPTALAAARTKADILVEAMASQRGAGAKRWSLVGSILAR